MDRQRNDRLGRLLLSEHRGEILRRCTERDTYANTVADPNRDRYAYSHSNGSSYANRDAYTWTAPAQGPEEKGGGNEYGASQLEGGNLAQHRRLPR